MIIKINGLPTACEGFTDMNKCKQLLQYCNPDDAQVKCVENIFKEATINTVREFPQDAYNFAYNTFHKIMPIGNRELHKLVDTTVQNGWGGKGVWQVFPDGSPTQTAIQNFVHPVVECAGFILSGVLGIQ